MSCEPAAGANGKRCQGKGVEKDTGVRIEMIFLRGQPKGVLTEQARDGIREVAK